MRVRAYALVEATAKYKFHCNRGGLFLAAMQLHEPTWLSSAPLYAQYLQGVYERTNLIPDWLEKDLLDSWKGVTHA